MDDNFLKVVIKPRVKLQIDILASVLGVKKFDFVGSLVDAAWQAAKADGKVTDAMLGAAVISEQVVA